MTCAAAGTIASNSTLWKGIRWCGWEPDRTPRTSSKGEYQAKVGTARARVDQGDRPGAQLLLDTPPQAGGESLEMGCASPSWTTRRGDGKSVGPGQSDGWQPVVIDESTPWVSRYRGLWGFFANDPTSGENAPAGPMYERSGEPRRSWYDPLGFVGLDKEPPPPAARGLLGPTGPASSSARPSWTDSSRRDSARSTCSASRWQAWKAIPICSLAIQACRTDGRAERRPTHYAAGVR